MEQLSVLLILSSIVGGLILLDLELNEGKIITKIARKFF